MGDIHHPGTVPLRARASFIALDRGTLHASGFSLEWVRESGTVVIPCGAAVVLLLEPGVSVTHAAVKLCADQGTLLVWVGEAGVRVYSSGHPGGAAGERILLQARRALLPRSRIAVARRFYQRMLGADPPPSSSIEVLRGFEGSRVKVWYRDIAAEKAVPWESRERAPVRLRDALGFASSTLYGIAEAVILAAGFSPAIGFIHGGDPRSLVFDLADTVKFKTVIPLAFDVFLSDTHDVRSSVRRACRDLFRESRLIEVLMDNLLYAMDVSA
jgi:CRISPR-associated protein Cas1